MNNDITAGYIIMDAERLRAPMQKITDHLLKRMGVIPSAEVIEFMPNQASPTNLTTYGIAV
jgi:nicotinamide mononucleotide (NMN) deamidase PncC